MNRAKILHFARRSRDFYVRRERLVIGALIVAFVFFLSVKSLSPASNDLFAGNIRDRMISDDSDMQTWGWGAHIVKRTFFEAPWRLFYGALYTDLRDAPGGAALWIPWNERILALLTAPLSNDATWATAFDLSLMVTNTLSVLWFAKVMRWSVFAAIPMAIALSINAYVRSRAAVHADYLGLFYIPLVFGALEILSSLDTRAKDAKRRAGEAALALMGALTAAHYYLIITSILAPMLVLYFFVRSQSAKGPYFSRIGYAILAALPALCLAVWILKFPLSSADAARIPTVLPEVNPAQNLQFLEGFGAHPVDYFTGDVKFLTYNDPIIARRVLSEAVRAANFDGSNGHERANGIAWSMWASAFAILVVSLFRRSRDPRRRIFQFLIVSIAFYAFMFSLSPRGLVIYGQEYGPSSFAQKIFPNFRVPSRFGPVVYFGVLVLVGDALARLFDRKGRWRKALGIVVTAGLSSVLVWETWPRMPMYMSPIRPMRTELLRADGTCGMGTFVPFFDDYFALQELRGTPCEQMYPMANSRIAQLQSAIGPWSLMTTPAAIHHVASVLKCTGSSWVVFRADKVPQFAQEAICSELGWQYLDSHACKAPQTITAVKPFEQCL